MVQLQKFGAIRYYEDDDIINWEPELRIKECFGIRTFWDLQQNQAKHSEEEWQEKMIQLEMRVSQIEEFRKNCFFSSLDFGKSISGVGNKRISLTIGIKVIKMIS